MTNSRPATAIEARMLLWQAALDDAERSARLACYMHRVSVLPNSPRWLFGEMPGAGFIAFQASLERQITEGLQHSLENGDRFEIVRALYEHAIVRFCSIFNTGAGQTEGLYVVSENKPRKPNEADHLRVKLKARIEALIAAHGGTDAYRDREKYLLSLRDQMIAHSDATWLRPEGHIAVDSTSLGQNLRKNTYALLLDQRFEDAASLLYVIRLWSWALRAEQAEQLRENHSVRP